MSKPLVLCQYLGESESEDCGYCKGAIKGPKTNVGAFFHFMNCDTYEKLLCRQWRRCGTYYYQPQNNRTCCPQYTIRLDGVKYVLTRNHKKVLRTMDEFLGKLKPPKVKVKKKKVIKTYPKMDEFLRKNIEKLMDGGHLPKLEEFVCKCRENDRKRVFVDILVNVSKSIFGRSGKKITENEISRLIITACKRQFPIMGIEKMVILKNGWIGIRVHKDEEEMTVVKKPVPMSPPPKRKKSDSHTTKNENKPGIKKAQPDEIVMAMEKAKFVQDEFLLYKNYQMKIHGDKEDEITEKSYTRFLIESSLTSEPKIAPFAGTGTYHLTYRLKKSNKLIAVSVLDVLINGMSSVYFFYDTSYQKLRLGIYSALREIEMMKKANIDYPNFRYYYLGFYIHGNQKMRYKAQFQPSDLVCNETFQWTPFEKCRKVLDVERYGKFADAEKEKPYFFDNTFVLFQQSLMKINMLPMLGVELTQTCLDKIKDFHMRCGVCSKDIAFYLNKKSVHRDPNDLFSVEDEEE